MKKWHAPIMFLTLIIVILIGCDQKLSDLKDTKWTLDKIQFKSSDPIDPPTYYIMSIGDQHISIQLEANVCRIPYKMIDDKTALVEGTAVCTRMCCDSELAQSLVHSLSGKMKITKKKNRLILEGKDKFEFIPWEASHNKSAIRGDYIKFKRSGCFGTCPIYTMTITADGQLSYNGEKWVNTLGEQSATISSEDVKDLFELAKRLDFEHLPEAYDDPQITDLENTFIEYNGHIVRIRWTKDAPADLLKLRSMLHETAAQQGWVKEEGTPTK